MRKIEVDRIQDKTNTGLQVKVFKTDQNQQAKVEAAHRDDHYIFFLLTCGSGTLIVDLENITVSAGQLYYILPSQIHYRVKSDCAEGWFLAVDASLIPIELRTVFENGSDTQIPVKLTDYELTQYLMVLKILHNEYSGQRDDIYFLPIIYGLVKSFMAMAASTFNHSEEQENNLNQAHTLTRQFKILLVENSHTIKSPSAYASKLNVTPAYLNQTVKRVTGSTISYWIQQELYNEAKRLLYHTEIAIKQVAYELGYTDYSYFVRFFRKTSGLTPSQFRINNRK